jgi:hypothetical protein
MMLLLSRLRDLKLILAASLFFAAAHAYAEAGVGLGLIPGSGFGSDDKKNDKKKAEPFIAELAAAMSADGPKLEETHKNGYGRTEMITIILISKKSGAGIDEVMKYRHKLMPLAEIAAKYNLPYDSLKQEAIEVKKQIEDLIYSEPYQKKLAEPATDQYTINSSSDTKIK